MENEGIYGLTRVRKCRETAFHRFRLQFDTFLSKDRRLRTLFHCLCDGTGKPFMLARRLKTTVSAILNLRKRLLRKLARFFRVKTSAEIALAIKNLQEYFIEHEHLASVPQQIVQNNGQFSTLTPIYK